MPSGACLSQWMFGAWLGGESILQGGWGWPRAPLVGCVVAMDPLLLVAEQLPRKGSFLWICAPPPTLKDH